MRRQKQGPKGNASQFVVASRSVAEGFVKGLGATAFVAARPVPNRERARYSHDGQKADWQRVGQSFKDALANSG